MLYLNFIFIFFISIGMQYGLLVLCRYFKLYQPIYGLSPKTHQLKADTPSLGGVGILLSLWCAWLFYGMHIFSNTIFWIMLVVTLFSLLGMLDDGFSLLRRHNQGLSSKQKFLLQLILSLILIGFYAYLFGELSFWSICLYSFVMVGSSNATNLTDGLDGLLVSCSMITLCGFFFVGNSEIQYFSIMVSLVLFGFFLFNRYPAKLFMGDSGSLGIGALFAAMAISMENVWILIPLGAVYILETVSVILQVIYFKWKRKRIFLMTPLHHHFELLGLSEVRVVQLFSILSFLCLMVIVVF